MTSEKTPVVEPSALLSRLRSFSPATWLRVLVVFQLALFAWQFTPLLSTNGDDATYVILGKALAQGKGYRQIHTPGDPVGSLYPPAFPAILAVIQLVTDNLLFAKIAVAFLGIGVTLLCFRFFKEDLQSLLLPFAVMIVASGSLAEYSLILLSEIPYLFFCLLSLILLEKSAEQPGNSALFWLAIVVSLLPVNCRSIGISFSVAWIVGNAWSGRYRFAVIHAGLLVLTTALSRSIMPTNDSYFVHLFLRNSYDPEAGYAPMGELAARVFANLNQYGSVLVRTALVPFAQNYPPFVGRFLSIMCIGLALVGWVRSLCSRLRLLGLYVFFYCGIVLLWQTQWAGERFLVGIVPFLYLFMLLGLEAILSSFDMDKRQSRFAFFTNLARQKVANLSGAKRWTVWVLVGLLVVFNVQYQLMRRGGEGQTMPDWRNFYSCADWARMHTPKDAVFMSRKPELFYMRSLRKGVGYPFTHDVEKVIQNMEKSGVTYVVHDNFSWTATTAKYLYPAIVSHPDRFKIVYALKNPDTYVLEFLHK